MRPHQIRQALDEYARRYMRPSTDLWPAIRRQVRARPPADRVYIEPAGRRVGRLLPTALLVLLVLTAVVLVPLLHLGDLPAPAATPSPLTVPGAPPTPTRTAAPANTPSGGPAADAATRLIADLAARLGTDPARLDAAFRTAADATIQQAVRDGQLTPAQADQAKVVAGQGLAAVLRTGMTVPSTGSGDARDLAGLLNTLLGLSGGAPPGPGSSAKHEPKE